MISVMGDWYFTYDAVDRLMSATPDVAKRTLNPVQALAAHCAPLTHTGACSQPPTYGEGLNRQSRTTAY